MKVCPKCSVNHLKIGTFCSRKCANSRVWSDNDKQIKSIANKQFYHTDNGKQRRKELSEKNKNQKHTDESNTKRSEKMKEWWTPERKAKQAEVASNRVIKPETLEKMSKIAKERGFGGHTSKRKMYFCKNTGEVIYLHSSYEIEFAKILESMGIFWSRPNPLPWVDEFGISHMYYPDFKVNEVYFDTKNDYLAIKDLPKINAVKLQNNVNVVIVTKENIKEEFIASFV